MSTPGPSEADRGEDDLALTRGCVFGVLFGAVLWVVVIATALLVWRVVTR